MIEPVNLNDQDNSKMQVINIKDLHKKDSEKNLPEDNIWYHQWWSWGLFGLVFSFIFIFMGFFDSLIFFVAPVGPIAGIAAWFIRKHAHKLGNYDKDLFRS
jgi:hypothetical protein